MEQSTKFTLEDMLRKVQALLARADHSNTPVPEAESCRAKAEALMYRYRINEATFVQAQPAGAELKPEWHTWDVCHSRSEFSSYYRTLCNYVLDHVGIRGVFKVASKPLIDPDTDQPIPNSTTTVYYCEAVGYESDLRIAEVLYTACMLAFQQRLEPKYDPSLSQRTNAYIMRSAGMEGWRIAQAIYGRTDKNLRPKVRQMFKAEALARGEDPAALLGKGNIMKSYREDFALGFVDKVRSRLSQMRMSRQDADAGELVLASRNEAINETFYAAYPQYRPVDPGTRSTVGYVDPRKGCTKCQRAKSGYCRDHGYLRPRVGRYGRDTNYTALDRGRQAAATADLGPRPTGGRRVQADERKAL